MDSTLTYATQTILSVQSFILAMVMHPEVQRTAHEELDRIVGQDRLPEFADRDSLPYISAIVKEVLRCCNFHLRICAF